MKDLLNNNKNTPSHLVIIFAKSNHTKQDILWLEIFVFAKAANQLIRKIKFIQLAVYPSA